MKKKLVSLVALASLFVIAGCGDNKESTKPETSAPSSVETTKPTEAPATEAPATEAPATEAPSTEAPAPSLPEMVEKTIDELTTNVPEDSKTMYKVSGIWEHTGNDSDAYGNGNLVDPVSGKSLVVYGMAPTSEAFTYDEDKGFKFTNPKKFQDIKSNFASGDKLTLGMVYSPNYKNYYTYFIGKDADKSSFTYNVEIGTFEHGSITADKTSGTYGEKVTLTITPDTDYAVDYIKLNDKAITAVDGVYSFEIVVGKNVITAGFVSSAAPVVSANLTVDTMSLGAYPTAEAEGTVVDGRNSIGFKYFNFGNYSNGIQVRNKNGNGYLFTTNETIGEIESLTIAKNAKWTSTAGLIVTFGTTALETVGTAAEDNSNVIFSSTTTMANSVAGAKYLRFDYTGSGAIYIDSITINFKTAA